MTVYLATFALAGLGQLLDCAIATAIGMTVSMAIVRVSIDCISVVLVPICGMRISVSTMCFMAICIGGMPIEPIGGMPIQSSCVTPIGCSSVGCMTILLAFAGCYGLLCVGSWISLCKYFEGIQDWTVPRAPTARPWLPGELDAAVATTMKNMARTGQCSHKSPACVACNAALPCNSPEIACQVVFDLCLGGSFCLRSEQ